MRAIWNNALIAEDAGTGIVIEGNYYFPPESVHKEFLEASEHTTECPWKGTARYSHIVVNGIQNDNAAWYYPNPKDSAIERVGTNFSGYVAFWNGVEIVD